VTARGAACVATVACGIVATAAIFHPGTMSVDALLQLEEARKGVFFDWHPPVMSWVLGRLDVLLPGPFGLLLLHNVMFWSGLGLMVYLRDLPAGWSSGLILGIGSLPPILSALGTLWKDVGMASALLLAAGLLRYADRRSSGTALALGLACLAYGFAIRHNAALAAYPLALWAGAILVARVAGPAGGRLRRSLVVGHVLFAAMGLVVLTVDEMLIGKHLFPSQQILIHDLTALSVRTGTVYVPDTLVERGGPITLPALACLYTPESAVAVFHARRGECALQLRKITSGRRMVQIGLAWARAVPRHPGAYAAHRLSVWREMLALGRDRVCYPLQSGTDPNTLGLQFRPTPLFEPVQRISRFAADETPLFRPWIYLVATLVWLTAALTVARAETLAAAVVGSSALLYALGYVVTGTTCDFRMLWWPIVAATVLPLLLRRRAVEVREARS
jgi:hypothetical protein